MEWDEAIDAYKIALKFERNLSDNTIEAYTRDIKKCQCFAINELSGKAPDVIAFSDLQEYLYQNLKLNLSERTQARLISSIKSFFKFLNEEDFRTDNPARLLEMPKLGLYLPDTLSLEEINQLIQAVDLSSPLGERNLTIIETLYGCGLRVSELTGLLISNINFKENYMVVQGKGDKMRLVPLADYTAELIQNYIHGSRAQLKIKPKASDILFLNQRGAGMTRVMVFLIIKDLAQKADLKKTISPHTFRHSFATHLLRNGADLRYIQEMLGHSSITTTEIYTHLENEELRDTIIKYHPRNQ
ncbi:site-specific tyrosine recombinase/integron integrase [Riemerella columbina]|uniref:site-specific tyrosine recombinase/integron integrase n=1 Tax=Riemerella columbina TaxID=103810 RepID=UPI00038188ED|nr:site-specific tyrosine recombinase/integron integrase [Riemerella columbina]